MFYTYVTPTEGCWIWQGSLVVSKRGGYGVMKGRKAHRVSYELHHGPIPKGMHVLHSCDNPPCVNPAHLRLGTDADNVRDMIERSRQNNPAKLSIEVVGEIRRLHKEGWRQKDLATAFGVSQGHVSKIIRHKRRG